MFLQTCWGWWKAQQKAKERWCERISCIIEGVYTTGLCISRFLFERESPFYVKKENWDQNAPSNSPRAPGTKSKFGKERVHREELSKKCEHHWVVPCAPKFGERSHEETLQEERCARRVAWDQANIFYKLKNADKATFYTPTEAKVMPAPTSKRPEER